MTTSGFGIFFSVFLLSALTTFTTVCIPPTPTDWGLSLGSGSRQSRDLQVDSKKLVIRQLINKKMHSVFQFKVPLY